MVIIRRGIMTTDTPGKRSVCFSTALLQSQKNYDAAATVLEVGHKQKAK